MSEEELQLLITLDDPVDAPEEHTFNHLQVNNLEHLLGQRAGAISDNDAYKLTFGQGDWTCTLSTLTGTTNDSMIEVCTVTHWENGEIVEQKVFYDLLGMQKQIGVK